MLGLYTYVRRLFLFHPGWNLYLSSLSILVRNTISPTNARPCSTILSNIVNTDISDVPLPSTPFTSFIRSQNRLQCSRFPLFPFPLHLRPLFLFLPCSRTLSLYPVFPRKSLLSLSLQLDELGMRDTLVCRKKSRVKDSGGILACEDTRFRGRMEYLLQGRWMRGKIVDTLMRSWATMNVGRLGQHTQDGSSIWSRQWFVLDMSRN